RRSALSASCRVCGGALATGAERKLRRHASCPASYDEETYQNLVSWRRELARDKAQPAFVIFTDATLIAIAETRPAALPELLAIPGVGKVKAELYGPAVLAIVAGGTAAPEL
ncbi:MAG: HRDC domain-containing protein, partial [Propionicimonas sp.]